MNYLNTNPETRQWLTPDHQALLSTIARWLDDSDRPISVDQDIPHPQEEQS